MFGVMAQDWFRVWLLSKLNLPASSVVFPPTNVGTERKKYLPDSGEAIATWCDLVRRLGGEL